MFMLVTKQDQYYYRLLKIALDSQRCIGIIYIFFLSKYLRRLITWNNGRPKSNPVYYCHIKTIIFLTSFNDALFKLNVYINADGWNNGWNEHIKGAVPIFAFLYNFLWETEFWVQSGPYWRAVTFSVYLSGHFTVFKKYLPKKVVTNVEPDHLCWGSHIFTIVSAIERCPFAVLWK